MLSDHSYSKLPVERQLEELYKAVSKLLESMDESSNPGLGDWISQKEAQELTGLSKSTLFNLRKSNQITSSSFTGKEVFYRKSDLVRLLDEREKQSQ